MMMMSGKMIGWACIVRRRGMMRLFVILSQRQIAEKHVFMRNRNARCVLNLINGAR